MESIACLFDPPGSSASVSELVSDSRRIVLATVESKIEGDGNDPSTFSFVIEEILKGRVRGEKFDHFGYAPMENHGADGDYDQHNDPIFWASPYGNASLTGTCEIFGAFEVGKTYLMIFGAKPHFKAFENIQSKEDFWLSVVRAAIDKSK